MTNEDETKKDNLILFPQNRIKKRITQPQESPFTKRLKEQQTIELLRKFNDMGLKTTKELFTKDLALVIDCIRGLIYRDFGLSHTAQLMSNKMVSIKFNKAGKAMAARIDYSDFMNGKKPKQPNVFNKEFKEELNDLQDGSDLFESDMDLNGDDDKK